MFGKTVRVCSPLTIVHEWRGFGSYIRIRALWFDRISLNSIVHVQVSVRFLYRSILISHGGFQLPHVSIHKDSWPQIRLDLWHKLNEHEEYYTHIFGSKDVSNIYKSLNFIGSGLAPEENLMVMPDTGLLIASRYNRVFQYLDIRGSNTMFPLWSSPPESQRHESIVIALVHGMHFVRVDLRGDYPMPYVHPYWKRYKFNCASGWEH
nr:hypothetical protein [Tanacetum cinerariifolium]